MANTIILPFSELQAELNDEAMIDPNAIIEITENGRYNVARYGYADVDVPQPSGKITITENGTDIDVSEYATADVNVSGGSSDFSTAEVTFICSSSEPEIHLAFINVQNDGIYSVIDITESTLTVTVPLYKNKLSCGIGPFFMTVTSTSGSITGTQMDGYIISGNCTINYSLPM